MRQKIPHSALRRSPSSCLKVLSGWMTQCFPSRCLFCSSATAFQLPYSFKASLLPVDTRKKPRNMLDTLRCAGSSARGPSWPADAASSTSARPPSSSERWLSMSFSSTDVASLEMASLGGQLGGVPFLSGFTCSCPRSMSHCGGQGLARSGPVLPPR